MTSHVAADVIFRTLFSIPIEHETAARVFRLFREYQRSQPILNLAALVPLPRWMPRPFHRRTRETAQEIRALISKVTTDRMAQIRSGTAPDDLATKIMTAHDPQSDQGFDTEEMVDQVAIFFWLGTKPAPRCWLGHYICWQHIPCGRIAWRKKRETGGRAVFTRWAGCD